MIDEKFKSRFFFVGFINMVACRDPSNLHNQATPNPARGYTRDQGRVLQEFFFFFFNLQSFVYIGYKCAHYPL